MSSFATFEPAFDPTKLTSLTYTFTLDSRLAISTNFSCSSRENSRHKHKKMQNSIKVCCCRSFRGEKITFFPAVSMRRHFQQELLGKFSSQRWQSSRHFAVKCLQENVCFSFTTFNFSSPSILITFTNMTWKYQSHEISITFFNIHVMQ